MTKTYIPTINISSLIKNNFETQSAFKTIREIEKAQKESCINEYKHTEGSLDYKNCMIIQEENFIEKIKSINS